MAASLGFQVNAFTLFLRHYTMARKTNQTGFGEKYTSETKRVINKDGSFNVIKLGAAKQSLYQYLIAIGWMKFSLWVFACIRAKRK